MVGSSQKGCFIEKPAWCDWPLKNLRVRQLGWWNSLTEWKHKFHVPNHQPDPTRYILLHLAKKNVVCLTAAVLSTYTCSRVQWHISWHIMKKNTAFNPQDSGFHPISINFSPGRTWRSHTPRELAANHWVNYDISLTWNVVPLGDSCPLLITIPGLGRIEVIRVYTECGYIPIDVH